MWPYHPDLLSTPVPRYTSFPTGAEFAADVRPSGLETALAGYRMMLSQDMLPVERGVRRPEDDRRRAAA